MPKATESQPDREPSAGNSQEPERAEQQPETTESFRDVLAEFEKSHARKDEDRGKQLEGTVVSVTADSLYLDIGYKTEGLLPLSTLRPGEQFQPGDKIPVSVKGRNPEGYYELSRSQVRLPADWPALERAFQDKATIMGTVTAVIKGGLSVDVGVRAFMPASRSGVRDAVEMEKMVGQEIRCRITKLDVADENVVVDRRAVLEEEERAAGQRRYAEIQEGEIVRGTVRSLTDFGAFLDIGGVDGLLHVSDISWSRVSKPADMLTVGQEIEAKVLKVDAEKQRISLGLKQLQPHPWDAVAEKYKAGDRARGVVTRIVDFGAFVELEPGIEGLIHISEMSWSRRIKKASDVVKQGDAVEAVILGVNAADKRISLGLKQALGDPWETVARKHPVGSVVEGPVTNITNFGAFVQLAEGVEGMVHVSDISADKRINHPRDVLKVGTPVQAMVLATDPVKRQFRLGMKQMVPTGIDEFLAEHKPGDVVTGRLVDEGGNVELGEGIHATCRKSAQPAKDETAAAGKSDLGSLSAMLQAKWKSGPAEVKSEVRAGQVRSFRIVNLDREQRKIEVEMA